MQLNLFIASNLMFFRDSSIMINIFYEYSKFYYKRYLLLVVQSFEEEAMQIQLVFYLSSQVT